MVKRFVFLGCAEVDLLNYRVPNKISGHVRAVLQINVPLVPTDLGLTVIAQDAFLVGMLPWMDTML